MYWLDSLIRDGWMGLRIYLKVRLWHQKHGKGPVTITIDGPGIELTTPPPDDLLLIRVLITLAKERPGVIDKITSEWLAQLDAGDLPWLDGETRLKVLIDVLKKCGSRCKHHLREREFKMAIIKPSRRPGVVILKADKHRQSIMVMVLTPIAWRIHQLRRLIGGWQKRDPCT